MSFFLRAKESSVFFGLFLLVCIFSGLSDNFLSMASIASIASVSTEMGILALGATILMIAGEYDLSIGSNFALSGMIFALLTTTYNVSPFLAFLAALTAGLCIGLINGLVTLSTRIPSFITTLGTMLILRGIVLVVTDGFPIAALESNGIIALFATDLGAGFKSSLLWWLFLSAYLFYILNWHRLGNHIMATGGNEEAGFSMGIKVKRVKLWSFLLTGVLAALAGVVQYSHLMSLSPTAGEQYELRAIAIAVIGGTTLSGGSGTIIGTIMATLIMGVLASGLVQAGVSTYWFRALVGLILVMAVIMNTNLKRLYQRA